MTHCDITEDGGSHKVAILKALNFYIPAIEQQCSTLIYSTLDESVHTVPSLRGDQGSNISTWLVT